jgi:predicted permease
LKLSETWRLSRAPYRESVYKSIAQERGRLWWGAFGKSYFDEEGQSDIELTKRALRIARFDKMTVALFNLMASCIPFASLFFGSQAFGLTSSISLSLAVTFGFTVLYSTQTLSSFVSAESSALLSTLPLSKDDFSLITLFSFIRSVDYMVMGSILSQVTLVAYFTLSPLATLLMLLASIMNAVFAVAVALWFSRLFHRNLLRGGRSKSSTVLRLIFIIIWGSLLIGVGFLFSVPWYIVPHLERTVLGLNQISSIFLCFIYPFSAGIAITNLVHPSVAFSTALVVSAAMTGYALLAGAAGNWTLGTVKRISQGVGVSAVRVVAKNFSVKIRNPWLGYVIKDLKTSSRNPATAFFFALPVLETAIVSLLITNYAMLRVSTMLVATVIGGILALFVPLALLTSEGTGLEYTKTLPISANRIIISKTLIATATYVPVPLTLLVMALFKQLTWLPSVLIPYFVILSIASASVFEIQLFMNYVAKGKIAAFVQDFQKLVLGVTFILIPELAYAATYIVSLDHILAISVMGIAAAVELATAVYLLRASAVVVSVFCEPRE